MPPAPRSAAAARIVVVAAGDPGHAFPALAVAAALGARGHQVTLASGDVHRDSAVAAGLAFVPLPGASATGAGDDLGRRLWGQAADTAPALAAALEDAGGVDLVVADIVTTAGQFAADLLGVGWLELSPHHLTVPDPELPPMGLGRLPPRHWLRRRDDRRLVRLQRRSLDLGREQAAAARARIGLGPGAGPRARLVATLPGLEYPRRRWPPHTHVVGSLDWDPGWPELAVPEGTDPLVLVTDSTATAVGFSLVEQAVDALRGLPIRLVGTTSRTDLAPWRDRCVLGRGPHGPLLDEAAVAVGLGGHGFLGKALSRGVPMVVVPWQGDQREAAARVVWSGAGRRLSPQRLTTARLRREVRRVLRSPKYTAAAAELARGARGLGPDHAADVVERYLP